ncbi:MAG: hypothetical protein JO343_07690 [Candidatus Eremiobacteraeota bacterium]|nr:hypothetical protein [Candidatus Eremiobacteraeota bacterium]MBV8461391.1 hypothetical protein [Candidatus Eremiobacteraeota bacterium]
MAAHPAHTTVMAFHAVPALGHIAWQTATVLGNSPRTIAMQMINLPTIETQMIGARITVTLTNSGQPTAPSTVAIITATPNIKTTMGASMG